MGIVAAYKYGTGPTDSPHELDLRLQIFRLITINGCEFWKMIEAGFRWRVRITVLQVRSGQGNGEVRSLVGQVHYSAEVYDHESRAQVKLPTPK